MPGSFVGHETGKEGWERRGKGGMVTRRKQRKGPGFPRGLANSLPVTGEERKTECHSARRPITWAKWCLPWEGEGVRIGEGNTAYPKETG